MKRIAILGATGSIGRSTLDLLRTRGTEFEPVFLAAHRSSDRLFEQAESFGIRHVALAGIDGDLPSRAGLQVHGGSRGILEGLDETAPDLVLNAITGAAGLEASAWTLEHGRRLLLANKESLVVAGPFLRSLARQHGGTILPVDSEHAAIHQCLRGEDREALRRVYLTASGGPFRELSSEAMQSVTREQALRHPTWKMGERITIGSATMMNKAFEVIEARQLFALCADEIEVLVHPQSIVHSMVEFRDGSIIAQLGVPDMRVPILYCLGWPDRLDFEFRGFDLRSFATLTFEAADRSRFPALDLGYRCVRQGGSSGAVLNAADEVATQAFLERKISFPSIISTVGRVLESHDPGPIESIPHVLEIDAWARREARSCLQPA